MKEEEERQVVLALEKEKEGLTSCCATLRADLEEKQRQANRQQEQIDAAQTKVKVRVWGQTLPLKNTPSFSFAFLEMPDDV